MKHSFDVAVAAELGVNCAVLLEHLFFWIEKNEANNKHYYDGKFWTYNSTEAFAKLFPYLNATQVRYALKQLFDAGYIVKGNYNASQFDRTAWYALTDKAYRLLKPSHFDVINLSNEENTGFAVPQSLKEVDGKQAKAAGENATPEFSQIDVINLSNGQEKISKPIPYIKLTDKNNKTDRQTDTCAHVSEEAVKEEYEQTSLLDEEEETIKVTLVDVIKKQITYEELAADVELRKLYASDTEMKSVLDMVVQIMTRAAKAEATKVCGVKYSRDVIVSQFLRRVDKAYVKSFLLHIAKLDTLSITTPLKYWSSVFFNFGVEKRKIGKSSPSKQETSSSSERRAVPSNGFVSPVGNFTQREYSDEFFKALTENRPYVNKQE